MHVAVVIVGFRNAGDLARCVAALDRSDYANFSVVIVENGGRAAYDADKAVLPTSLSGGQRVDLVEAPSNLGFAGGVNLGIHTAAGADAWWVLNPDAIAAPDALSHLVARLAVGDCEAVGGVLHFANGRIQSLGGVWHGWIGRAVSIGAGEPVDAPIDGAAVEARLDYLVGASVLVHRRLIDKVGLMREDYFLYAEELEWFLRAKQSGIRFGFAPGARVLHHQGTTTGWAEGVAARPKMPIYLDERNRLLLTRDRFPARVPIVAAGSLVFMLARFARKRAWKQIGYGLAGWRAGLANQRGVPAWLNAG